MKNIGRTLEEIAIEDKLVEEIVNKLRRELEEILNRRVAVRADMVSGSVLMRAVFISKSGVEKYANFMYRLAEDYIWLEDKEFCRDRGFYPSEHWTDVSSLKQLLGEHPRRRFTPVPFWEIGDIRFADL